MATVFGASDLAVLFREFGVPVRWDSSNGEICGRGLVDESDQDSGSPSLAGHEIAVTLVAADFSGLAADETLTVDEIEYRVVQVRQLDDGALMRAWCARKS